MVDFLRSKRIILFSLLLLIGLVFVVYRHTVPTLVRSSPMVIGVDSLEELEEMASYIVEVTVVGESKPLDGEFPYSITPIRVVEVYKGNVSNGDQLEIMEFYRNYRGPTGLYTHTIGDYLPMQKGSNYLLFLREQPNGWLASISVYYGKYVWPIPEKAARSAESLELYQLSSQGYLNMIDAVVAKYGQRN